MRGKVAPGGAVRKPDLTVAQPCACFAGKDDMEEDESPPSPAPLVPAAQPPVDAEGLRLGAKSKAAAGLKGVQEMLAYSVREMGLVRAARTLLRLNKRDGFDCQSCASCSRLRGSSPP